MKPSLIIIGLGNPGTSYAKTRHNVGFRALDAISKSFGTGEWKQVGKFDAEVQEARIVVAPVLLVKPQTFMNLSGEAVKKLCDFYKVDAAQQLLVIADDIDLPLAEVRFRSSGGPGTHNGLKSIVQHIGERFPRLRIGLGEHPKGDELATWVLSVPTKEETEALDGAVRSLPDRIRSYVLESSEESPSEKESTGN